MPRPLVAVIVDSLARILLSTVLLSEILLDVVNELSHTLGSITFEMPGEMFAIVALSQSLLIIRTSLAIFDLCTLQNLPATTLSQTRFVIVAEP